MRWDAQLELLSWELARALALLFKGYYFEIINSFLATKIYPKWVKW